jgi:hypothetical protein
LISKALCSFVDKQIRPFTIGEWPSGFAYQHIISHTMNKGAA